MCTDYKIAEILPLLSLTTSLQSMRVWVPAEGTKTDGFVSANTSLHQYNSTSGYKTHHDIKTLVQNCIRKNTIETVRAPSGDLGDSKVEQGE